MSERLTKFLIELSKDPLKRQQFKTDPQSLVKAAGLDAAEQQLVLARNSALVRAHFGTETVAHLTDSKTKKKKKKTTKKK